MALRAMGRAAALLALSVGSVAGVALVGAPAQASSNCGDVFQYHLNAPYTIQASNGFVCNGSATNTYVITGADTSGAGPFSVACG